MHEMSIAQRVLDVIEEQALVQGFNRVTQVWLEIGPLAMIDKQALRFSFNAIIGHSCAAGAELTIIDLPGEAVCRQCGLKLEIQQRYTPCPHCKDYSLQVVCGEEMRIKELEVA